MENVSGVYGCIQLFIHSYYYLTLMVHLSASNHVLRFLPHTTHTHTHHTQHTHTNSPTIDAVRRTVAASSRAGVRRREELDIGPQRTAQLFRHAR